MHVNQVIFEAMRKQIEFLQNQIHGLGDKLTAREKLEQLKATDFKQEVLEIKRKEKKLLRENCWLNQEIARLEQQLKQEKIRSSGMMQHLQTQIDC